MFCLNHRFWAGMFDASQESVIVVFSIKHILFKIADNFNLNTGKKHFSNTVLIVLLFYVRN